MNIIKINKFILHNKNENKIYIVKYNLLIKRQIGDWGLGIGDWGLGIGDWADRKSVV